MHHQTKNLVFGESVAQQVEHNTFNVGVPGSSPGGFTKIIERQSYYSAALFFCGGRQIILYNRGESSGNIQNFVARAANNHGIKVLNVCGLIKIAYLCALFSHVG